MLSQEALTKVLDRLLVENGIFRKEDVLDTVKVVSKEMKRKEELVNGSLCSFP
jgi:hypothetical protein